jgi:hypothetical protein
MFTGSMTGNLNVVGKVFANSKMSIIGSRGDEKNFSSDCLPAAPKLEVYSSLSAIVDRFPSEVN